jgi:hypothetical protein
VTTTSLDDVLRRLATTTRRTRRTTRSTADGDVAGANRTTTMRGGDTRPAWDGWAGRGRGTMMPPQLSPPPPSLRCCHCPRIITVAIAVVVILLPLTPRIVCHRPRGSTRRPSTEIARRLSTTRIKTMRRHCCRRAGIRTNDDSMTTTTTMVT